VDVEAVQRLHAVCQCSESVVPSCLRPRSPNGACSRCRPRSPRRRSGSRAGSGRRTTRRTHRCARRPGRQCRPDDTGSLYAGGTRRGSTAACTAAVPGHERPAVAGSSTMRRHGPDLGHLLVVAVLVGRRNARAEGAFAMSATTRSRIAGDVRPAVVDEVLVGEAAGLEDGEVSQPRCLPAGSRWRTTPGRSPGCCARRWTTGALEHEELAGVSRQVRMHWTAVARSR